MVDSACVFSNSGYRLFDWSFSKIVSKDFAFDRAGITFVEHTFALEPALQVNAVIMLFGGGGHGNLRFLQQEEAGGRLRRQA